MHSDIFGALSRYSSAEPENYLTEAFAFLLRILLVRDQESALNLLCTLCGNKEDPQFFSPEDDIVVFTQVSTEHGRPDMTITSPGKLVYIEVKDYSGIGYEQLQQYKDDLDELRKIAPTHKRLVLLTRDTVDPSETRGLADNQIRWHQIDDLLRERESRDQVSAYFIYAFREFLKEKKMTLEKVGWEYINGVPALSNLMALIETAADRAHVTGRRSSTGRDYAGFTFEQGKYWCGVSYGSHLKVIFQILPDKVNFEKSLVASPQYSLEHQFSSWRFRLDLEAGHFFSLSVDEQIEKITTFIIACLSDAKKGEVPQTEG